MHDHDHSQCAHAHGHIKLTPSRQLVLDKLCAAGRPVGAYEMIDILAAETGKRPAPVSVYRALDFLLENGLVHRLASRNAYMACAHQHGRSAPGGFSHLRKMRARDRGDIARDRRRGSGGWRRSSGFVAQAQVVEITGRCKDCAA